MSDSFLITDIPPVPAQLIELVAFDHDAKMVLVEPRQAGNALYLTWFDRVQRAGLKYRSVPTELDKISQARLNGGRARSTVAAGADDAGLKVREAALALLRRAASYRASDIHLLLKGTHAEIQFRVKGELRVAVRLGQDEGEAIARAFYQGIAVVKEASYTPLECQNAQISGEVLEDTPLSSVRIIRGPSYPIELGGGFMVLRLQYGDFARASVRVEAKALERPRVPDGILDLERMGYSPTQAVRLERMQDASSGIVIFTGPTGSGKTTTINEMCKQKARLSPGRRQVAIENPIEYPQPWAVQMVISNTDEAMFAEYLRMALRMDPDEIFFGEIRDAECALAVLMGALTGHFIRSTLHTHDAYSVPARIEIMDQARLSRRLTCDSKLLRGITAQRLVPRLCPHCAEPLLGRNEKRLRRDVMEAVQTYGDLSEVRVRGEGCVRCSYDGVRDRVVVAEVVETDARLMQDFIEHGTDYARQQFRARADTDNSIMDTTMRRVLIGEVDPATVPDYVDPIPPLEQVNR